MAKKEGGGKGKNGNKKHGRQLKKAARRGHSPISRYVLGRISFEVYWAAVS